MEKSEQLARKMYDNYCKAVGGKAYNGDPLPTSEKFFTDETKKLQCNAWIKVAETSLEEDGNKTLHNSTASQAKNNVKDIVFWGDGDMWKLLGKASSKNEKWMKSTKAMEIHGLGCLVQVTTQQGDNVAEAITFVPQVKILEQYADKVVVYRKLVKFM